MALRLAPPTTTISVPTLPSRRIRPAPAANSGRCLPASRGRCRPGYDPGPARESAAELRLGSKDEPPARLGSNKVFLAPIGDRAAKPVINS